MKTLYSFYYNNIIAQRMCVQNTKISKSRIFLFLLVSRKLIFNISKIIFGILKSITQRNFSKNLDTVFTFVYVFKPITQIMVNLCVSVY